MNTYVYHWELAPRPDIRVELQIEARDVITARREVIAFLGEHGGASWRIEGVSRVNPAAWAGPRMLLPPRARS